MPSVVLPELEPYTHVPETKEQLDWASLTTIDLSKYGTPEGNKELSQALIRAINSKGFFYVTNFGISQQDVDLQFALGQAFYKLSLEDKLEYIADLDAGNYTGYRPAGRRPLPGDVPEKIEMWNMSTEDGQIRQCLPKPLDSYRAKIKGFSKALHDNILDPLNHLIALALELPEDYFKELHRWDTNDESHLRYMKYSKFSQKEVDSLKDNLWIRGHTDLGSWTLLFRQPVAGLQIRDPETNEWKWAKPLDGSLTVNAGDALSYLTGGYIKSTVHRVAVPPKDQRDVDRLGLMYFTRPQNEVPLKTVASPVLQREGCAQNDFEAGGHEIPTMAEFTRLKQTWNQRKDVSQEQRDGQQILPGVIEKRFV
ncbi:2OG-Fe(II) oxygenase superfamily protein [Ilyonectria destructans]|nr:2OG-Fe(II) oxygenase superfamily protein [Ilyonectria destructans]